jgi:hypothetical protein
MTKTTLISGVSSGIDKATALEFILPVSTSIKRPILESENGLFLGLPKVCC